MVAPAVLTVVAGTMIAPTLATPLAMVDDIAPAGTATEAFAWLATATAIGASLGAAIAGVVTEGGGPTPAFVLAGGAAAMAALIAMLRARTLTPDSDRTTLPCNAVPATP